MGWCAFLLVAAMHGIFSTADQMPTCQPENFHYEYTECDSAGGRWRVSVPKPNTCTGGSPNAAERGIGCEFTCDPGKYIEMEKQECYPCPPGTYSLGGGVRFDDWDTLPKGFVVENRHFIGTAFSSWMKGNAANTNCTSNSGWVPRIKHISAMPDECQSVLSYTATLVRAGSVTFYYQYTGDSMLTFQVQNSKCEVGRDRHNRKFLSPPKQEEGWKKHTAELKSGVNVLMWKAAVVTTHKGKPRQPIRIHSIELTGIAFTSECQKCKAGSYSKEGAAYCQECVPDSYSLKGAADCTKCDLFKEYSNAGAPKCTQRLPCTQDDYFETSTGCINNQTHKEYKWIDPKVCRDDLPTSVALPSKTPFEACPPCNPGMQPTLDGKCEFCPEGTFSGGATACQECPASTAPEVGIEYKWWNSLPDNANISAYCLSLNKERGCATEEGWMVATDHIHSGRGHADDVYLVLSLKLDGFRGEEQLLHGKPVSVAQVSFVFELSCQKNCSLIFLQQSKTRGSSIIEAFFGNQPQRKYTYDLVTTEPTTLIWAYQKMQQDEDTPDVDFSQSFKLRDDVAKIYTINVTNTQTGGASTCKRCPKGADLQGCIPCPPGQYIEMNTTECNNCPINYIVHGQNPWGREACTECGEGLYTEDHTRCETSCAYTTPSGQRYDFTQISGVQIVEGTRLFTSGGTQYYHLFNISLCGNSGVFPTVGCHDNISYPSGDQKREANGNPGLHGLPHSDVAENLLGSSVEAVVCRSTIIPPLPGDEDGVLSAQPVSLGDALVNITTNHSSLNMKERMEHEGFTTDAMDLDVHFVYVSDISTPACRFGRSTIITLRCDVSSGVRGSISTPPHCSDGTCDGCNFHFMWRSRTACPICETMEFRTVPGECVNGKQNITRIPPSHCVYLKDSKTLVTTKACKMAMPAWLTIVMYVVPVLVVAGMLLIVLVCYCWMKNKNLEYKYSKLIASASKDGELPAAETCALEDGEEEDGFDSVQFKDKGRKFFSKFRLGNEKKDGQFFNLDKMSAGFVGGGDLGSDQEELFSDEEVNNRMAML